MRTYFLLCALLFTFADPGWVQGANVVVAPKDRFTLGASNWNVNGETNLVTLKVSKLTFNHSGKTGGLKMILWATTRPYQPGTSGYTIAEVKLGQLATNEYYHDINRQVSLVRPAAGTYYLTLMVLEYNGSTHVRQLYAQGTNTFTFR